MRFPLPKPKAIKFTYCKFPIKNAPKTGMVQRRFYDCGYCAGCDKRRMGLKTSSVEGLPFLCEDCYSKVYQYSLFTTDPYRLKKIPKGKDVDVNLTRKVIKSGAKLKATHNLLITGIVYDYIHNK